jgi:hypothetical protein
MRKTLLWILAFCVAAGTMVYQRLTGPTYPLRGSAFINEQTVKFRLPRSAENTADGEVRVPVMGADVGGYVEYKRFKTDDPWSKFPMVRKDKDLVGYLPKQPRAGKLAYRVVIVQLDKEYPLTGADPVVIRFRGAVPAWILIPHVLFMFLAMLLAARAGLAALDKTSNPQTFAKWAALFLFLSGFILGPLMQYYGFGKLWTGFPLGKDLTDTKTLVAMIGWLVALFAGRKGRPARGWVLAAAVLFLIVFLVPHSVMGSELDYSKVPAAVLKIP